MGDIRCDIARTKRELRAHFGIRHRVFVEEQQIFSRSDVDRHDRRSIPLIARHEPTDALVGAVRCYREEGDTWYGGRLAVLKQHRGRTAGAALVKKAEEVVRDRGCRLFLAHVQVKNVPFFRHLDWRPIGDTEMYHGLEHQLMETEWSRREGLFPVEPNRTIGGESVILSG